jgi:hypothetical protein
MVECEVLTDIGQTVEDSSGHCDTEPSDGTYSNHTRAYQELIDRTNSQMLYTVIRLEILGCTSCFFMRICKRAG